MELEETVATYLHLQLSAIQGIYPSKLKKTDGEEEVWNMSHRLCS